MRHRLAWYAVRAVKRGRPAVGRMNGKEPLSRYAQVGSGIRFERQNGEWIDKLVEDKRASVPDQVAAKLDVRAWFATLTKRMNADRQGSGVRLFDERGCTEVRSDGRPNQPAAADA